MSELYLTYEKTFIRNMESIKINLKEINLSPETSVSSNSEEEASDSSNIIESTEEILESQIKLLKQMEIELVSLSSNSSLKKKEFEEIKKKFNSYKKNIDISKKKLIQIKLKENNSNKSFNNSTDCSSLNDSINMTNNENFHFSENNKLKEVRKILNTTEDTGNNILVNMETQIQNMKYIELKIKNMNNDLDDSNKVLNRMKKRIKKNKKLFIILVIIFIVSFIGFTFYKFLL